MSNTEPLLGTFHNAITGETVTRELTADELAEQKVMQDEIVLQAKAQADKAKAKQAVLTKLGLTADEVKALLS
jgi:hypothetical protein